MDFSPLCHKEWAYMHTDPHIEVSAWNNQSIPEIFCNLSSLPLPLEANGYVCTFWFLPAAVLAHSLAAAAAKSLQSCSTLCDPINGSPPGSAIPGILQARTLQWVAISSSNAWKWKVKVKSLSHVRLFTTPWTAAYQASTFMGFSKQEYWSGLFTGTFILKSQRFLNHY